MQESIVNHPVLPMAAYAAAVFTRLVNALGVSRPGPVPGNLEPIAQPFSSRTRGASRAWGLACTLILLFFCLAPSARAVPPGTVINNSARATYRALGAAVSRTSNTVTLVTTWRRTSASMELLQYAPTVGDARQVRVPQASFDLDGAAGGDTRQIAAIYPAGSRKPLDLTEPLPLIGCRLYHQGEPVFLQVVDLDQNMEPARVEQVWVMVSVSGTTDTELLLLTESGPDTGIFLGYLQTGNTGTAQAYDGLLDVAAGTQITAQYTDIADSGDRVMSSALVDPYGLVFDSSTGQPLSQVRITLVNTDTGLPATVYGDDGTSIFPATITSGGTVTDSSGKVYIFEDGYYRFPFVTPGRYRLQAVAPAGYAVPSTAATADLQRLPGAPFVIAEPGSRGEPFFLNPGPAIRMDIPVDPGGLGLWVSKRANRDFAAVGDFIQYTVTVENITTGASTGVRVRDRLPRGFRFRGGSARLDKEPLADPRIASDGRVLTFTAGDLEAGATARISYVAEVAAGAKPGRAENKARALSTGGLTSNEAVAAVTIKEDLFRSDNFIAGRVIADNCEDAPSDGNDGVAGVRLYLEDGTYAITDDQGMYHFEAVCSGLHVVQLDLTTLGPLYDIAECRDNTRAAGTPFSRFVDLHGGALWRVDFHVKSSSQGITATRGAHGGEGGHAADAPPPAAQPLDMDHLNLETLSSGFAILSPAPEARPHIPSIKLAVQHRPGDVIDLLLNGQPVSPLNFEGRRRNKAGNVAVSFWRGVDLATGDNRIQALRKDTGGNVLQRLERVVHYSDVPVEAHLVKEASHLVANGRDIPVIALRLLDKDGQPARLGIVGNYEVLPPYSAAQGSDKGQLPRTADEKPHYTVDEEGIARLRLQPTTQSGTAVVRLPLTSKVKDVRVWLRPEDREWILVGLAQGTLGYNTASGNMENFTAADQEENYYKDGHMAFFAKGKVKGGWLLTAAFDSARDHRDPNARLFQELDPDTYYTLYGDATRQQYEAPSIRKLYLKIERETFYALFGDYDTGLDVTELSRYSRRFNGLKTEYNGGRINLNAFATESNQAFVKDEIRGDGTSGLYHLSRGGIVINSEKIVLETRDRLRSEVILASRPLTRHIDYAIDYDAGTLFFKSPVDSRDKYFNPIFIVAEYESDDPRDEAYTYGGRGAVKLAGGRAEAGATYVREGPRHAEADLTGVDIRADLGGGVEIKAEAAKTKTRKDGRNLEGQAYLAEISKRNEKLDTRAYYREQGEDFGLGQQNASEDKTRKIGSDLTLRLNQNWRAVGELYRQSNLATGAERDLGEAQLRYNGGIYQLNSGLRQVEDRFEDGARNRSTQLLAGVSRQFLDNRVKLRASREQALDNDNDNVDFPTRTLLGADYQATRTAALFAEHEITQAGHEDTHSSRAGIKATPWQGGQVGSSLGGSFNENGDRLFAGLGLSQTLRLNDHWSVDGGFDRTQTLNQSEQASFNTNVPDTTGAQEDFTAVSAGAGYKADLWSWTGRVETRLARSQNKYGLVSGVAGEVRKGLGLSAGVQYFRTQNLSGADETDAGIRLSLALRPRNSRWIVFDRLDYKREDRSQSSGRNESRRIINNLNLNVQAQDRFQVALQYGAKYVLETFDGAAYSGYTDLSGLEARYDLTTKWDLGLHTSMLHAWNAGQLDYRAGVSVGYALFQNTWSSLGYNFTGFKDEDFSAADYTAQGPFVRFRVKFNQQSVREMVSWFKR